MENIKLEIPYEIASGLVKKFGANSHFWPACKVVIEQNLDNVYIGKMLVNVDAHTHMYLEIETKNME
jgi:hypothetical protein